MRDNTAEVPHEAAQVASIAVDRVMRSLPESCFGLPKITVKIDFSNKAGKFVANAQVRGLIFVASSDR